MSKKVTKTEQLEALEKLSPVSPGWLMAAQAVKTTPAIKKQLISKKYSDSSLRRVSDEQYTHVLQRWEENWSYPKHPRQEPVCRGCQDANTYCSHHYWLAALVRGEKVYTAYRKSLLKWRRPFVPYMRRRGVNIQTATWYGSDSPAFLEGFEGKIVHKEIHQQLESALTQWLWWWMSAILHLLPTTLPQMASWEPLHSTTQFVRQFRSNLISLNELVKDRDGEQFAPQKGTPRAKIEDEWYALTKTFNGSEPDIAGILMYVLGTKPGFFHGGGFVQATALPYVQKPILDPEVDAKDKPPGFRAAALDDFKLELDTRNVTTCTTVLRMPTGHYLNCDGTPQSQRVCYALAGIEQYVLNRTANAAKFFHAETQSNSVQEELFWAAQVRLYALRELWGKMMRHPSEAARLLREFEENYKHGQQLLDDLSDWWRKPRQEKLQDMLNEMRQTQVD